MIKYVNALQKVKNLAFYEQQCEVSKSFEPYTIQYDDENEVNVYILQDQTLIDKVVLITVNIAMREHYWISDDYDIQTIQNLQT